MKRKLIRLLAVAMCLPVMMAYSVPAFADKEADSNADTAAEAATEQAADAEENISDEEQAEQEAENTQEEATEAEDPLLETEETTEGDTGVASITITTTDGNGNKINVSTGYVGVSSVTICDEDGNENVARTDAGDQIKVRGNSTAAGLKKPFNLKFDSKTSVLGMPQNKKWCLLANCFDPTLLRNCIACEIGQDMGLMVPEYHMVELTLDGVYKGCYMVTQTTEDTAKVDTGSGEFFLEYEAERKESEHTYFTSGDLRFVADDPEYEDLEDSSFTYGGQTYKEYIQSTLDDLTSVLDSNDYSKVKENFDVETLAKFYLFNEFYKTADAGYSSVNFLYRDHKLTAGPMWDYDLSCGNSQILNNKTYFDADGNSYTGLWANKQVFAKLLNYQEFNQLVYDDYARYKGVFAKYYTDGGIVDQMVERYSTLIDRNYTDAGWDISKIGTFFMRMPDPTYEENLDFYTNWMSERNKWLGNNFCTTLNVHKWDDGTVTTQPTNTSAGVKTCTCSVCGSTKTATVARISSVTLYKGVNKTYKLTSDGKARWKIKSGKKRVRLKGATLKVRRVGKVRVKDRVSGKYVTVKIKRPTISTRKSVKIKRGQTLQLTATATPKATVKFYVKAKKYKKRATVTTSGLVTAKKKGTCYIYARANGVKKKIKVNVR